jgi:hypothetical protein
MNDEKRSRRPSRRFRGSGDKDSVSLFPRSPLLLPVSLPAAFILSSSSLFFAVALAYNSALSNLQGAGAQA